MQQLAPGESCASAVQEVQQTEHVLPDGQRITASAQQCHRLGDVLLDPGSSLHSPGSPDTHASVPLPESLASVIACLPEATGRKVLPAGLPAASCGIDKPT